MRHSVSSIAPPSWCVWAAVAITLLSLAPQLRFWMVRGTQWQGAYIVLQPDEVLYSAYVNAIIDGRPARNDPSAGQDDNAINPMPESLFSIQFLPAFVVAYLARLFRVSAASAFIALLGFAGLFGSLSVYWLHASISGDKRFAAISVLAVFAFGATAAGQGLIGLLFRPEVKFLGMPFLRRYEPGGPFPLFFLFCTFVWFTFTVPRSRTMMISAFLAGGVFVSLIFSYLYLWTAAIAWIACVCCIWFFLRGIDLRKSLITSALLGAPAVGG